MIDLRSDTVTRPTQAMREAMVQAPVGDDVYGDDPTVIRLETLAAQAMGKEAALFVASGTMGNQLAVMTHTRPGDEIICGAMCHIIQHEVGGHARLSGVSAYLVDTADGPITAEQVRSCVRDPDDIHLPRTTLLCLENAMSDGTLATAEQTAQAANAAHALGLKVHLDGARIFNAATALNTTARELVASVDSVMFCLSKGLCAPVGSMLCGSKEFIARARKNRKMLGGGMRQAGVLAACGILSINEMTKRLADDHRNARTMADALAKIPGVSLLVPVQTSMVWVNVDAPGFDNAAFVGYLKAHNVLINGDAQARYRFVTHRDVSEGDVLEAAGIIGEYVRGL